MDDDENGEVTFVNVMQLKVVAQKLEPWYKPLYRASVSCSRNQYWSSGRKSSQANNQKAANTKGIPKRI